ncbi:hypothetical protein [Streptomyces sp. NPDC000931]
MRSAADGQSDLPELLEEEADLQNQLGVTADHVGAVSSFLNKQKPTFTGQ